MTFAELPAAFLAFVLAGCIAGLAAIAAFFVPIGLNKLFVRNPPPINTGPIGFGLVAAVITAAVVWPYLTWYWWP